MHDKYVVQNLHIVNSQVNKSNCNVVLKYDGKEFCWEVGQSLLQMLESEGIVKLVFPLHGRAN